MTIITTPAERTPFMPVLPGMGTDGNRNPVDTAGTENVLQDYTAGNGAAAVNEAGQVTTTNSPEFSQLSERDREKMSILAAQIRSFGC